MNAGSLQEPLAWRLIGAALWQQAVTLPISLVLSFCTSRLTGHAPGHLLVYAWLHATQFAALVAQRLLLSSFRVPPVHYPELGLTGASWPSVLLSRLLLRHRRWSDLVLVLMLLATTTASACSYIVSYSGPETLLSAWSLLLVAATAAAYTVLHLLQCAEVLQHPSLQRHRYFRLKQQLPSLAAQAVKTALLGALTTVGLWAGLHLPQRLASAAPGASAAAAQVAAAAAAAFGWAAGSSLLQIVFSERLALSSADDANPVLPVLDALSSRNTLMQVGLGRERRAGNP